MLNIGDRVERYEVESFLGEGGLARVYRVRHEHLGAQYALKVLSFRGTRLSNRLLREGRIQARLKHRNVVTVHDVFELDGRAALLMEYVEGESLEQALNRQGAFPLGEALAIFSQMLAGVSAAHDNGVLHRDLKPGNILLQAGSGGMVPKVTDFGIARLLSVEASGSDTLQTDVIGTPGYMAPEQASDPTQVDVRADVFSLGAILYGLVTGWPAFRMTSLAQILSDVERGAFTPVLERMPECPPDLAATIERCLAPDPEDRFADCRQLAAALYGADSAEVSALGHSGASLLGMLVGAEKRETPLPKAQSLLSKTPSSAPATTFDEQQAASSGAEGMTAVPSASVMPSVESPGPDVAASAPAPSALATLHPVEQGDASPAPEPAPTGRSLWPLAAVAVVLLAVGGWWVSRPGSPLATEAAQAAVATPTPTPPTPRTVLQPGRDNAQPADLPAGAEASPGSAEPATVAAQGAQPNPAAGAEVLPQPAAPPADTNPGSQAAAPQEPASEPDERDAAGLSMPETEGPEEAQEPTLSGADAAEDPASDASGATADVASAADADAEPAQQDQGSQDAVAAVDPEPTPPPEEAAPAPQPASPSLTGTWKGRLGGRASTLRVTRQSGSSVTAELEVLLGTAYRTFSMTGTLVGDRLRLEGDADAPWSLDARLIDGSLEGGLTAPGRRKATPWRGTRD